MCRSASHPDPSSSRWQACGTHGRAGEPFQMASSERKRTGPGWSGPPRASSGQIRHPGGKDSITKVGRPCWPGCALGRWGPSWVAQGLTAGEWEMPLARSGQPCPPGELSLGGGRRPQGQMCGFSLPSPHPPFPACCLSIGCRAVVRSMRAAPWL